MRRFENKTMWRKLLFLVSTIGALAAVLTFTGGGLAMTNTGGTAPWVASDKADYAPGSTVHLTGGGWQPGEAVEVVTNDSIGNSWMKTDNVTADDTGAITDDVVLPNYFISDYSVTATGAQSGTATTNFTDAASLTLSPTSGLAGSSVSVSSGGGPFDGGQADIGIYWDGTVLTTNGTLVATCSTNNGGNIAAGTCSFTVPANASVGPHKVVATDKSDTARSVDAAPFTVTAPACTAASVTTHPSNQSITYGANVTFTAGGGGSPAPTVQWQVSTNGGASFTDISGATSTTLTLTRPAVAASGNKYHAVFTNTCNGIKTATTNDAALTIARKAVTVTPNAGQGKTYGASDPALTYTSSPALESGDSFSGGLARATGESLGSYPINLGTLSAGNNYNLSLSATTVNFSITPKPVTVTADDKSKTYGAADPAFTFQVSGLESGDSLSGVSCGVAGAHANAGSYDITCSGNTNGNYSPAYVKGKLTVDPKPITVTADAKSKVYGSADPALTYSLTSGSLESGDSLSGSLTRDPGESVAGSPYAIKRGTLSAGGNYDLTFIGANLTITAKSVTVTADDKSKTYGSADPAFTFHVTGLESGDSLTGVSCDVAGAHTNAGSYDIACSGNSNSNYDAGYESGKLTVDPKPVTVTADDKSKTYGSADPAFTFHVTGLVSGDSLTGVSCDVAGAHANAGSYDITCSGNSNSNYDASYESGKLTVNPKPITLKADAKSKVYGLADPALTYSLTSGSLESGDSLSGNLTRDPGETVAGSPYAIKRGTLTAGDNYDLTFAGANLTITAKPITGSFTADDKVYDGDASATILTRSLAAGDKVGDDDVSLAGGSASFNNKNVGTNKPVTGSGFSLDGADKGNYMLVSVSGTTASIKPRPITVTADAKTKTYGNPDPALTYSVTAGSLVTGDSLAGALAREPGESVADSPYAIKQGTLTAGGNYDLSFVGANLTVTARAITVTADAKSKTYGEADPELTYKVTSGSLVNGDGFSGALTRDPGESVLGSPYAIKRGTLTAGGNYDLTFVGANLAITARAITVTAADKTKVLGAADPQFTYSITSGSLAAGDALSGNLTRDAGDTIGSYAIKQGTLTADPNYNLTFVNGTLKIVYATGTCLGSQGHAILQPINIDGTSIFKQGSTVPAKFRVCDVNGNSIGSAGVVSSFKLVKTLAGTLESTVNESVDSTTPDTAFRWSASDQQWIFNINTKSLKANTTYAYDVMLNDGTKISFQYGLK
jgi:hypothetical protein